MQGAGCMGDGCVRARWQGVGDDGVFVRMTLFPSLCLGADCLHCSLRSGQLAVPVSGTPVDPGRFLWPVFTYKSLGEHQTTQSAEESPIRLSSSPLLLTPRETETSHENAVY